MDKSAEFKVGVFTLIVLLVIAFFTFRIGGFDWLYKKREYTLYVYFRNIGNLDDKSQVRIAGVTVGKINKIELSDNMAKITIGIHEGIKIPADSVATIRSTGLLGDRYLEIRPGRDQVYLREGDTVRNVEEMADMDEMLRKLSNVSENVDKLISSANEVFGSEESKEALKESIINLRDITASLRDAISRNDRRLEQLMAKLEDLADSLKGMIDENREPLKRTIAKAPEVVEDLKNTTSELKSMIEENRANIRATTEQMSKITTDIQEGKGTLGKLMKDERLYESLNKAAEGVNRTITRIERFRTFITFQGDYLFEPKDTKGYFNITLQPTPEKYYILGIVSDPIGKVTTTETVTRTDGTTVVTKKEEIEKKIEFTAQFGRRFKNTALRFGLTESTFGVGIDQFFMDDRLRLSVDAWDFGGDEAGAKSPHVRTAAEYVIFKNFFLTAGYDNIFNSRWRGPFIGGGVRFEDEDFKYIFGTVPKVPQ
ncbi:MAG: MCE family protein [Thermodesulfovibrionales bacterium]|nr:MCE family protein [Thermodesulfovibrionales bacterium]